MEGNGRFTVAHFSGRMGPFFLTTKLRAAEDTSYC